MKRLFGSALRIYCVLCGMLVGPAAAALILAHWQGKLGVEQVRAAYAALRRPAAADPASVAAEAREAPPAAAPAAVAPPGTGLWERRLETMGAGILSNVSDLGNAMETLDRRQEQLDRLALALAGLLTALLGEPIASGDLLDRSDELLGSLEARGGEEQRWPWLLETLAGMEARSLAAILAGGGDPPALPDREARRLLAALPARKAAEVLGEMGKKNPSLAARLVGEIAVQASSRLAAPGTGGAAAGLGTERR